MRGRRPKPTVLKLLHRSEEPINQFEPQAEGDLDTVPGHFNEEQRAAWNYVMQHAPPGLLKKIDTAALECWVVAHCIHRHAVEEFNRSQELVETTERGSKVSVLVLLMRQQAGVLKEWVAEFGFSPSSRPRISVVPTKGAGLNGSTHAKVQASGGESIDEYLARAPKPPAVH